MRSILLAAALLGAPLTAAGASKSPALDLTPGANGVIRCAAPKVSADEANAVRSRLAKNGGAKVDPQFRLTIPIAFHVLTCGAQGDVSRSQIDAQVRSLNDAYRGTGFSFTLASVDRTDDCRWFSQLTAPGVESHVKQALAIDPAHRLNVYTADLGHNLLGWSYFPQSFAEDSYLHGVVIHYGSLPGGFLAPYNLGGTLDHEVGHYLGLYHTFQNGCTAPGDDIDDTPFEATPAAGCPIGRNTCPQPGDDPIHNYMDYTDDACYSELTPLQAARMHATVTTYRPRLFEGARALTTGGGTSAQQATLGGASPAGLQVRGALPNPFSNETTFGFSLPQAGPVSLKLYSVAGRQVAVLVDGERAAGEQSVSLRAGTLAPGMYYAALRFAGVTTTRSVIVLP